jgi:hypothetical protein
VGSALCANLLASEAHENEIPRRTSDGQVCFPLRVRDFKVGPLPCGIPSSPRICHSADSRGER